MGFELDTICIHGKGRRRAVDSTGAISFPIYQTATYAHPSVGKSTGFDYNRVQNPTREELERIVADLEHGTDAIAFSTGMAAVSAFMELFKPGDHVVSTSDLYGGVIRQFNTINRKNGIEFTYLNTQDVAELEAQIRPTTKLIYVETPTNPMMQVTDIEAASKLAKKHGCLLAVDNTFLSPYFQNPLDFGADVVLHSATKYLEGHNDTLGGFVVVKDEALSHAVREIGKTTGGTLAPFDAWLILRGVKTLSVRMERHQQNALAIVDWLERHPRVRGVFYPGLPSNPGYEISKRQTRGFGGMLTFQVDSGETARRVLERLDLIQFAESLGGTESLMTYPLTQTHADVPAEMLRENGIDETTLRMSVGLENMGDLIADLAQALE